MSSLFKSTDRKAAILSLYDDKLQSLNLSYESLYVDTTFGSTHILKTGSSSLPPLLLIHGSNGCAPIGLECYPNLTSKYQVFAVDVLAQPNKSAETRLSMKDDTYGQWIHELIKKLELDQVVLAGVSFGGLIILKTLVHYPTHIKEAFLASPAYVVNGNPLRALFKIFIPMKRYMKTQKMKYIEQFLAVLFTARDEFAVDFLSKVFLHFEMDFTPVPVISTSDAKRIQTPMTILGAKEDVLFPGSKMEKRARKIFSSLRKFVLLDTSKHVQDAQGNKVFEELVLR